MDTQLLAEAVLVAMFFAFMGIIMVSADLCGDARADKDKRKVVNYNKRK